jgi:beta-glucanase (GH16 family)
VGDGLVGRVQHQRSARRLEGGPDNPFRKPHYLLLNPAIGGAWGGEVDDSVLAQKYLIDYVRVYQDKSAEAK